MRKSMKKSSKYWIVSILVLFLITCCIIYINLILSVLQKEKDPICIKSSKSNENGNGLLTIFTVIKDIKDISLQDESSSLDFFKWIDFINHHNGIGSWITLGVQIIAFGTIESCQVLQNQLNNTIDQSKVIQQLKCLEVPCINKQFQAPTIDCIFQKASEIATTKYLMFSNSDIVFFQDLLETLDTVSTTFSKNQFVIVGKRTDLSYPWKIDFRNSSWIGHLNEYTNKTGVLHSKTGIDFFLFQKDFTPTLLPFLIGRVRWDNWLLARYIGDIDKVSIDATNGIRAIHLNNAVKSISSKREGNDYNINLASASFKRDVKHVGDLEQTDLVFQPKHIQKFERRPQTLDAILFQRTNSDFTVVLSSLSSDHTLLGLNFECGLERLKISNYFFHTSNQTIFDSYFNQEKPIYFHHSKFHKTLLARDHSATQASEFIQQYLSILDLFDLIIKILSKGYNVLYASPETIFKSNPLPILNPIVDIQAQSDGGDTISYEFSFLYSSSSTVKVFERILGEMSKKLSQTMDLKTKEQAKELVSSIFNTVVFSNPVTVASLSIDFFTTSKFLTERIHQSSPIIIRNNMNVSLNEKITFFREKSAWFLTDFEDCKESAHLILEKSKKLPTIKVKLFASESLRKFENMLQSLDHFQGYYDHVSLDIFLQSKNSKLLEKAKEFIWKGGAKKIQLCSTEFPCWSQSWFPIENSEIGFFVNGSFTPQMSNLLNETISRYSSSQDNFSSLLSGISISPLSSLVSTKRLSLLRELKEQNKPFLLKKIGEVGTVFFPSQWSEFLLWFNENNQDLSKLEMKDNSLSYWYSKYLKQRDYFTIQIPFDEEMDSILDLNRRDPRENQKLNFPKVLEMKLYDDNLQRTLPIPGK